jgi:hypothetical protein
MSTHTHIPLTHISYLSLTRVLACLVASLCFVCPLRAIQIANEYWVAIRTDGLPGSGTLDDPFNGSTATQFDTIMNGIVANSTIHVLAGTFQTRGNQAWTLKTGQKLSGSGIAVTTLKLVNAGAFGTVVASASGSEMEVSDLTLDCNYVSGAMTYAGVQLQGSKNAIRRVKVIKAAGQNGITYPIAIGGLSTGDSLGNIIEDCELSNHQGGFCYGIYMWGSSTYAITGTIRHNTVFLGPSNDGLAFSVHNGKDCLIEGNYANGCNYGYFSNTGFNRKMLVTQNVFKNCTSSGVNITAVDNQSHASFINNSIELPNNAQGFTIWSTGAGTLTNFLFTANKIQYNNGSNGSGSYAFSLNGVKGTAIMDNTVQSSLNNSFVNTSPLNLYNNFDFSGNLLTNINQVSPVAGMVRRTVTGNAGILYSDKYVAVVAAGASTLTLPPAASRAGKDFIIMDEAGNAQTSNITIQPTAPETINNSANVKITTNYGAKRLMSDGTKWFAY